LENGCAYRPGAIEDLGARAAASCWVRGAINDAAGDRVVEPEEHRLLTASPRIVRSPNLC